MHDRKTIDIMVRTFYKSNKLWKIVKNFKIRKLPADISSLFIKLSVFVIRMVSNGFQQSSRIFQYISCDNAKNYSLLQKSVHDLIESANFVTTDFVWGKNLYLQFFSFEIAFYNFPKIGDINENDTCIILLNVLWTIQQQNLIKKLKQFFENFENVQRKHTWKVLPKVKISVSNYRSLDHQSIDWWISILKKIGWTV